MPARRSQHVQHADHAALVTSWFGHGEEPSPFGAFQLGMILPAMILLAIYGALQCLFVTGVAKSVVKRLPPEIRPYDASSPPGSPQLGSPPKMMADATPVEMMTTMNDL